MPKQRCSETHPVVLSVVSFNLDEGEEIFLTYSTGREHGPSIQRSGRGSPFMERLYPEFPGQTTSHPDGLRLRSWLIQEDLRQRDLDAATQKLNDARQRGAAPEVIQVLEKYQAEIERLTAHDTEFARVYQDYEIIGQQGCGDLTMNLWNVAYVNSPFSINRPALLFLYQEPLPSRTYSCLVKWKAVVGQRPQVTIEDLRFSANAASANEMVWAERGGAWVHCGDAIEFAVSNQQVLRDGNVVDISRLTHQFSDLRHLLKMPNLNPPGPLFGGDRGRPRFYYGRTTLDDIWFGEAQLIDDVNLQRAAMTGPVFLSRLYGGLGVSREQVEGAMRLAGYSHVADTRIPLAAGEYRFVPEDDSLVEVYLRRSKYGWSFIGLPRGNNEILCLACEGDPAAGRGHVLEDAVRKLLIAGSHNALLIDEGADVFQKARLGLNGQKAKVAGGGPELDITVPLKRTRLRATFIFARKKP